MTRDERRHELELMWRQALEAEETQDWQRAADLHSVIADGFDELGLPDRGRLERCGARQALIRIWSESELLPRLGYARVLNVRPISPTIKRECRTFEIVLEGPRFPRAPLHVRYVLVAFDRNQIRPITDTSTGDIIVSEYAARYGAGWWRS